MKPTLFSITSEYLEITNELVENGGELTEELEQALAINQAQLNQKAVAYHHVIQMLEAEATMAREEKKRLDAAIKSRTSSIERLKSMLDAARVQFGKEERGKKVLKIGTLTLSSRVSNSVKITDENALDNSFKVWKATVDKKAIKEAIDSGEEVKGAVIETNETLSIR